MLLYNVPYCHLVFNTLQPHHSSKDPQTLIPDSSKETRHTEIKMILVHGESNQFWKKKEATPGSVGWLKKMHLKSTFLASGMYQMAQTFQKVS